MYVHKNKRGKILEYRILVSQEHRLRRAFLEKVFNWERDDILTQWEQDAVDDIVLTEKKRADYALAIKMLGAYGFETFMRDRFLTGYPDFVLAEGEDDPPSLAESFIISEMDELSTEILRDARKVRLANARAKKKCLSNARAKK